MRNFRELRVPKTIQEKSHQTGRLTQSDCKIYRKAVGIKTEWCQRRDGSVINGPERRLQRENLYIPGQRILHEGAKSVQGGEICFS